MWQRTFLALALSALCGAAAQAQLVPDSFGAMGASETQGTTFTGSWVPYLAIDRGQNWGGAGQPYNVAVGGATSATLLTQNQHTQTRNNVQAGNVDAAYISIGGNDFNAVALQIASGSLNGAALTNFINNLANNIATAIDTVGTAQPAGVVVVGLPELMLTPGGRAIFDTPTEIARGRAATDQTNAAILSVATSRFLPFVDIARAQRDIEALPTFLVGGVTINRVAAGPDAHNFFQDAIHPGAVGNGLIANLFSGGMNVGYLTSATPLSDLEIITRAGLAGEYTGETFSTAIDYRDYVVYPDPSNVSVASFGASTVRRFDPLAVGANQAGAAQGLLTPLDLRYDADGNLLVADTLRSQVTKITPGGTATTLAGIAQGVVSPSGLALDAAGNALVTNYLANTVVKVTPGGSSTVFADAADGLSSPFGLTVDSLGQTYVADLGHARILRFDAAGNASVFADAGDGLLAPLDVEVGPDGRVYVADVLRSQVLRFTTAGVGSVWADVADGLTSPSGLSFDERGNLYVSNYLSNTVVKVNSFGRSQVWADAADGLSSPFGLATRSTALGPAPPTTLRVAEPTSGLLAAIACGLLGAARWRSRRRDRRRRRSA